MAPAKCWICHGKKANGKTCGYGVPIGEKACNSCGHEPPIHVSCPPKADARAAANSPKGPRRKADNLGGKGNVDCGADKLKSAMAAKTAADLKGKETAKALAAANAELKQLKAAVAAGPPVGTTADSVAMEQDSGDASATNLAAAITQAREELKQLQDCTEFYKSLIPDFGAKLVAARTKLDAATAARRAADPLKKQLEGAEEHQTRMAKKLANAKAGLEAKRRQLAEAQATLEKQQASVAEAEATAGKADAEVAVLAARFASERNAAPAQPAAAATTPVAQQPLPAGCVSIEFAEEKWAEREAAFAQQVAQLQAMVVPANDAASEASPSEAGDSDLADPLDDGAWNKVERTKRHKLLHKEREMLARNVRSKLAKVSATNSPFARA
jgi:chromosome segregation ATPase